LLAAVNPAASGRKIRREMRKQHTCHSINLGSLRDVYLNLELSFCYLNIAGNRSVFRNLKSY